MTINLCLAYSNHTTRPSHVFIDNYSGTTLLPKDYAAELPKDYAAEIS